MRIFLPVLLVCIPVGLLAAGYAPWWYAAPLAFAVTVWRARNGWEAFFGAFVAVATLWLATAAYKDAAAEGRLSIRVAELLQLGSRGALLAVTTTIGGLTGGLGGLCGFLLRRAFRPARRRRY